MQHAGERDRDQRPDQPRQRSVDPDADSRHRRARPPAQRRTRAVRRATDGCDCVRRDRRRAWRSSVHAASAASPLAHDADDPRHQHQRRGQRQQRRRDRMREEHRHIALADRQRATELRLRQRSEDQADHGRRDREAPAPHHEAEQAEDIERRQIDDRLMQAVGAERGEHQDARVQQRPRDHQHLHPQADQRQVQDQQQDVADVHAGDQAPHQRALRLEQQRARLDAVVLERRQQDRRGRRGRNPQRQQRHQHAGRRRVVGGLGSGHALDRAVAEFLRILGELLLQRVRQEGRDLRAARRNGAERESR